jgi:GNAT superfamily N-acetyltransferase
VESAGGHIVRAALDAEVGDIQAIGVAAGRRFADIDDPRIAACADDPPIPGPELRAAVAEGRLWVAVQDLRPVGFLLAGSTSGSLHVEELAVAPEAEGRGHGTALLDAASARAGALGFAMLTLTTFAEVPWNRPFYERRGFEVVDPGELTPELRRLVAEEAARGLAPELRVVMARRVAIDSPPP